MKPQDLNTPSYRLAISASSAELALPPGIQANSKIILFNDSTESVFVRGSASSGTLAAPTDGNSGAGKMIGSKQAQTFTLTEGIAYIQAIQLTAGTGDLFYSFGEGV